MRNQIINLVLTGALLTTSSLCAMEVPHDEDSKASIKLHTCATCVKTPMISLTEGESTAENVTTPLFSLKEREVTAGKGNMSSFPDDIMTTLIIQSGKGAVTSLMYVSKHMYNLCVAPSLWHGFAQKEKYFKFDPILCPKYQVHNFYNLFKFDLQKWNDYNKEGKPYYEYHTITASQLIHFKQDHYCIETEIMKKLEKVRKEFASQSFGNFLMEPQTFHPNKNSWLFEIGNRKLILKNNDKYDCDYIDSLAANAALTFCGSKGTLTTDVVAFHLIYNDIFIIKNLEDESLKNLVFGSEEYVSFCKNEFHKGMINNQYKNIHLNDFRITLLPDEEQK